MKRTKGSQSEVGMMYQYGVTTLLAAQLSRNNQVADYIIYSSEKSAGKFDDIVARIKLKDQDDWYLYLIQAKYKDTKRLNVSDNLKGKKIEYFLSDYIQSFNDILGNPHLTCRQGIPDDNIKFSIFCNKGIQAPVFLRQDCTFQLNVCRHFEQSNELSNVLFPFGNKYWKFACKDLENSQFQKFFDNCCLYLEQSNYNKLLEEACQTKNTKEIINYVKDYFNDDDLYKQGLRKEVFEIELQTIRLVDDIPPITSLADLTDDNRITIWNEISINHDIITVNSTDNFVSERYLYSCLVRKVNSLLNINIDVINVLDDEVIEKFLTYSKTKRFRYWVDPPRTLRLLLIELWKCGDLPLILKTHIKLSNFERYAHLKRSYIVLDDWTNRSEDIITSKMVIFTSLSSISNPDLQESMLTNTVVSPQGRQPVTLKNLLQDDEDLMSTFTCADILRMMSSRTPFLKEGYYKGVDYLAFIIEDEECVEISDRIEPYGIGHNFRVTCPLGRTDECIEMIRGHAIIFEHYTIYHLRKTGEKLVLTQGDPRRLNHRFVDQYGNPLFISDTGECIPILGQAIELNELQYIHRLLRRVTVPRSLFSSQVTQICVLSGDLNFIERSIKFSSIDDVINETISTEEKTYFVKIRGKESHQYYWQKLCHLQYPIFDIYVRDGQFELLRYKNCKNLSCHISYDGGIYSEQEFLNEIKDKTEEIAVVTGDAGIGKSSFLRWLCNNYSTQDYIIFYDLLNFQLDLNKSKRQRIDLIDFIFNESQKGLPKQYTDFVSDLRRKKKLIWVLDSFDEIRLACEKQVLDLIGVIANSGAQIVIATRVENCNILMDQFDIRLIKIEPLNEQDCLSHWELDQHLLNNISSELATNPLYLNFLKMISANREELASITKYTLYEKVINMKVRHCLRATYQILHDCDVERVVLLLEKLALVALFGKELIEAELCWACNNEVSDMAKFGIVIRFDENNYPIFYHRSFVEFLFAQWIAKAWRIDMYKYAARHLYKHIFTENKLHILNILFEDEELHRNILQGKFSSITKNIKTNSGFECWNIVDKLGRTTLHVIAICLQYPKYRVFCIDLLELFLTSMLANQSDMNKLDIMNWNWSEYIQEQVFVYACALKKMNVVEVYLQLQRKKIDADYYSSIIFPMQYFYALFHFSLESCQFDMISDLLLLQNFRDKIFFKFYQACLGLHSDSTVWWTKNLQCEGLLTLLHIACIYGSPSIIQRLIRIGADVNAKDFFTCTPLHYSIMRCSSVRGETVCGRSNNIDAVKLLLEAGALPNTSLLRINEISPLCLAVQTKNIVAVKMLLDAGAKTSYRCENGDTALHFAVRSGSLDILRCLLYYGVPLGLKNSQNETAMDIAVKQNNREMVDLLPERQNATDAQEREMRVVYMGPIRNISVEDKSLENAVIFGNIHLIKILLRKGAEINRHGKYGLTPLEIALCENNVDIIKLLLSKGADVNIQDTDGNSVLHRAAVNSNTDVVDMILGRGANIDVANIHGSTALHYSIATHNLAVAKLLLERGASVNAVTLDKITSLMHAVEHGNEECVRLLLENGADPNIQSKIGRPPLNIAISHQHKKIIELLIRSGANVNAGDKLETTPLLVAVYYNDISTFQLLLEKGANLNDEDATGYTPLLLAAVKGNDHMVRLLLEQGVNPGASTKGNISALYVSAMNKHARIVSLLLKANVIIDSKGGAAALKLCSTTGDINTVRLLLNRGVSANIYDDSTGCLSLHSAVANGHVDIVDLLLEKGAYINANCKKFATPLHQAVLKRNKNMAKLVIDKGGNVNGKSTEGITVLRLAIETRDVNIIEFLLEENVDINHEIGAEILEYAINTKNINIIKLLLNKDVNVNIPTKNGFTPLYIAIVVGNIDIVELLLEHEADVNIMSANNELPFTEAVAKGYIGIATLLINKGASVDTIHRGCAALHIKTYHKDIDFVKFLIEKGADLNIRAANGFNALQIAIEGGDANIVNILLEGGADINSHTSDGNSLLQFAAREGKVHLVELLLSKGANTITDIVTGNTLLHDCVCEENVDVMEVLLKKKVDLNIQDNMGNTALHVGIIEEKVNSVKLLLDNNADHDIMNINGETPFQIIVRKICINADGLNSDGWKNGENIEIMSSILEKTKKINVIDEAVIKSFYWATEKGHLKIIKLLLIHGINVNVQQPTGYTPLHVAVLNNNKDIVETLLENGADVNLKTNDGFTSLDLAKLKGYTNITDLFIAFSLSLST